MAAAIVNSALVDCLIIGGGPAGLSTALTLGRLHRSCIIFDDGVYRNQKAHRAHGVLTRDHVPPSEIRKLGREDIKRYDNTKFVEARVEHVKRPDVTGGTFTITDDKGNKYKGRTVVLATGAADQLPDIPGYAENWGSSIYQCPICDGHERAHQPAGVLAYPSVTPLVFKMSTMLHNLSKPPGSGTEELDPKAEPDSKITLFTNGPVDESDEQMAKGLETCRAHGITINQQPVVRFAQVGNGEGVTVHLRDGTSVQLGYIFHKPSLALTIPNIIRDLGLKTAEAPFGTIIVSSPPFTAIAEVSGVYVAGDNSVMMASVTSALLSGNIAGAGVAHYCNELDDQKALARWKGRAASSQDTVDLDPKLPDDTGCITAVQAPAVAAQA